MKGESHLTDTPLSIPDLIAQLSDANPAVRQRVAKALRDTKPVEIIEPLIQIAQSNADENSRNSALYALGMIGDVRVIPFLVSQMFDPVTGLEAALSLANLAPSSIQPLMDVLADVQQPPAARGYAVEGLGDCIFSDWVDHPAAKPPAMIEQITDALLKHLDDKEAGIRESCAYSLGWMGAKNAVPALIARLQDPVFEVRRGAIDALGRLKDTQAIDPLITCLNDPDALIRACTAKVLGWFYNPKPAPYLLLALQDADGRVRAYAADSLGKLKVVPAVDLLIACLDDPTDDVRWHAAIALGQIRDPRAVEPLRNTLQRGTDRRTTFWCIWALAELGDEATFQPLIDYLQSDPKYLRPITQALGDLGNPTAFEPLMKAWMDNWNSHYFAIVDTLKKLDLPKAMAAFTALARDDNDPGRQQAAKNALQRLQGIDPDLPASS